MRLFLALLLCLAAIFGTGCDARQNSDNQSNQSVISQLSSAIESGGDISIIQRLLDNGANANGLPGEDSTPLMVAIENRRLDVAEAIIDHGALVNIRAANGMSALHLAAATGLAETKFLLDAGADIEAVESLTGGTPLSYACMQGDVETVRLLLERGANPCAKTLTGHSILRMLDDSIAYDKDRELVAKQIREIVSKSASKKGC